MTMGRWIRLVCLGVALCLGSLLSGCEAGSELTVGTDNVNTTPDAVTSDTSGATPTPDTARAPEDSAEPTRDAASPSEPDLPPEPEGNPEESSCEEAGCFGTPCDENADCFSGFCVLHMGETVCSKTCDESCPEGWRCAESGQAGDIAFICVSKASHLCLPCHGGDDCDPQSSLAACLDYGDEGKFCGSECDVTSDCPEGFSCEERETAEGGISRQCARIEGLCECSEHAVELGLTTPCQVDNDFGSCVGSRQCTNEGLSLCDAPVPTEEICDGLDNDCDGETDESTCDDGLPCTQDWCNAQVGCEHQPLVDVACDDGDACTFGDGCQDGVCVGEALTCDDTNPCTDDACDETFGCIFTPNAADCDDNDPCTFGDRCAASSCEPGDLITCDDQNPCTTDVCDEAAGCTFLPNAEPCDDGDSCTLGDSCVMGECLPTETIACDDNNLCTTDVCDPEVGCQHLPADLLCDDEDPCTVGDQCVDGACESGSEGLNCADENPCTDNVCVPGEGCEATPNSALCDDQNPCTTQDLCQGGVCTGGQIADCDDGNLCTDDSCDAALGCVHTPNTNPCTDNDPCTLSDTCSEGICVGSGELSCADDNPCTDNLCIKGDGCVAFNNAEPCQDGDPCTAIDTCMGGECTGLMVDDCDDDNPCTDDVCIPGAGCSHTPNGAPCDDGDPCTLADTCLGTICQAGVALSCDDQNPCTDDVCDPNVGCVFGFNSAPCDDGNPCSIGDGCVEGGCKAGLESAECDDDNPCTTDSCDVVAGCVSVAHSEPCDDQNPCTIGDTCNASVCEPGPQGLTCDDQNPCTDDVCDPEVGCTFTFNNIPCDDQNECTQGESCTEGLCQNGAPVTCDDGLFCNGQEQCLTIGGCVSGTPPVIDDGIECTVDSCDEASDQILHLPDDSTCHDGAFCNGVETCSTTAGCQSGTPPVVDDGIDCTVDFCDDATDEIVHLPDNAACDDDTFCNGVESCSATAGCQNGAPPIVDDGIDCTVDICNESADAVQHIADASLCDDQNPCNGVESCNTTSGCQGGVTLDCNDGIACTSDACVAPVGCTNTPNSGACNDNNSCTTDACVAGLGCIFSAVGNGTSCTTSSNAPGQCSSGQCVANCQSGSTLFAYSGSAQTFQVPSCASTVTIEAWGAQGGARDSGNGGGRGAYMSVQYTGIGGLNLEIRVGGKGANGINNSIAGGGGGGGSFVTRADGGSPLVIAGGGGGESYQGNDGQPGLTSEAGGPGGYYSVPVGQGGYTDNGGGGGTGAGGGGWLSAGTGNSWTTGGSIKGGAGGLSQYNGHGGFGGGGAAYHGGGGGGGYTGGSGGTYTVGGGGGGSYSSGSIINSQQGNHSGNGQVIISW